MDPITVDVWSDVVCPWCYIGKRRLEAGIAAFTAGGDAPPVEVVFHSYELMPDTSEDFDGTVNGFLAEHRGLPQADIDQAHERIARIAAGVGLEIDFAARRQANTRKAHQVLHLARARGVQVEAKERLLRAHFVEGRHVGRDDELADLAAEVGLERDEVLDALRRQTYLAAVEADQRDANWIGFPGVPFFVIDHRYTVTGAQPAGEFTQLLEQVRAEREEGSAA